MRNIKLKIEYDGARYDGWTAPKVGGSKGTTISDKISDVLKEMENEEVELIPAMRTEAGVHAYSQIATFKTSSRKKTLEIKQYLNRYLPRDIAVLEVSEADERFHPAFNAKAFSFEYRLVTGDVPSVFDRKYNYYCFKQLDIKKMTECSGLFVGKHDFAAFTDNKRMKKSTVREIFDCEVYASGNEITINVSGDDFWPNMVRIMVATLVKVGSGELELSAVEKAFATKDRSLLPEAIDAKGLFLCGVKYE